MNAANRHVAARESEKTIPVERPGSAIACCLALAAHAIAIVAGIAARNDATTVLTRAILALVIAYIVGQIIATVLEHVAREHIEAYKKERPVPDFDEIANDSHEAIPPEQAAA